MELQRDKKVPQRDTILQKDTQLLLRNMKNLQKDSKQLQREIIMNIKRQKQVQRDAQLQKDTG